MAAPSTLVCPWWAAWLGYHWLAQWPEVGVLPCTWLLLMVLDGGHLEVSLKEAAPALCSLLMLRFPHISFKLPHRYNFPFKTTPCDFVALALLEEIKI